MTLYVNCCARKNSRTNRLAHALLDRLGGYEEIFLYEEDLQPLNQQRLEQRNALLEKKQYDNAIFRYARQFAAADVIVIAAPFWDLSFPAQLKNYIENIYVTGIVTRYDEKGQPQGLCHARKLYYVTTAGGPYDGRYSYEYLKTLAQDYFGIGEVELVMAQMLDIVGNDPEQILGEAIESLTEKIRDIHGTVWGNKKDL